MNTAEVGRQLRALRAASGRTVASVAGDAGLSVPYIANLENGRGNPTAAALSQIASALGMRLQISLVPADGAATRQNRSSVEAAIPPALIRLGRTPRFRAATELIAGALALEPDELRAQLVRSLSTVSGTLQRDLTEADWWRLIDALTLIAASPAPSS